MEFTSPMGQGLTAEQGTGAESAPASEEWLPETAVAQAAEFEKALEKALGTGSAPVAKRPAGRAMVRRTADHMGKKRRNAMAKRTSSRAPREKAESKKGAAKRAGGEDEEAEGEAKDAQGKGKGKGSAEKTPRKKKNPAVSQSPAAEAAEGAAGSGRKRSRPRQKLADQFNDSAAKQFYELVYQGLTAAQRRALRTNATAEVREVAGAGTAGMGEMAHRALMVFLEHKDRVQHCCERDNGCKAWVGELRAALFQDEKDKNTCVYSGFKPLQTGKGACAVHEKECPVEQEPFLAIMGYVTAGEREAAPSVSVILDYLRDKTPSVLLAMSTEDMGKKEEDPEWARQFYVDAHALGYERVYNDMVETSRFLVPLGRRRSYALFIKREHFEAFDVSDVQDRMATLTRGFECVPLPLDQLLMSKPPARRLSASEGGTAGDGVAKKSAAADDGEWKKKHRDFLRVKGLAWDFLCSACDKTLTGSKGYGELTSREQEVLAWALRSADGEAPTVVDVGRPISQVRSGGPGIMHTLTPPGKPFLVPQTRLLAGCEAVGFAGAPLPWSSGSELDNKELMNVASAAADPTVIMAVLIAFYVVMPPYIGAGEREGSEATDEDDDAARVVGFLQGFGA